MDDVTRYGFWGLILYNFLRDVAYPTIMKFVPHKIKQDDARARVDIEEREIKIKIEREDREWRRRMDERIAVAYERLADEMRVMALSQNTSGERINTLTNLIVAVFGVKIEEQQKDKK